MAYGLSVEDREREQNPLLRSLHPPEVRAPEKMKLDNTEESPSSNRKDQAILQKIEKWRSEAEGMRSQHDVRWAKNIRLVKGIWPQNESTRSKVRNRSKIFFRKIWSSNQRLAASMHQAFLKETDQFRIEPRMGNDGDDLKAAVLEEMTKYRRDVMMRSRSLYIKLLWGIMDIIELGLGVGKMRWVYNPETGEDEPDLVIYPPEQVYMDLSKPTKEQMRFIIFEDYVTKEDLEDEGYTNLQNLESNSSLPHNVVRSARYERNIDPLNIPSGTNNSYPKEGQGDSYLQDKDKHCPYVKRETFYREGGKIMMVVTCGQHVLKGPMVSPYGKRYNAVFGNCLTTQHQIIGEGFPEPLEGPQESLNVNLNQRKDNIATLINGEHIVGRYSNVDLHALSVSRPSNIILADDPNAVQPLKKADYTQTAYMEAAQDEGMMSEMSAITPGKLGLDRSTKATTSQLNFSESNAKIDLFISIVSETFFRDFFSTLAYMIQQFETDENVFRIANDRMYKKGKYKSGELPPFVDNVEFEADCIVQVGAGTVSQEIETRNLMLAMDRANMSNQAMAQMAKLGLVPPDGIEIFNIPEFMKVILPKLGQKNVDKFFLMVAPPPPEQPEGGEGGPGGGSPDILGLMQPQAGSEPQDLASGQELQGEGALPL